MTLRTAFPTLFLALLLPAAAKPKVAVIDAQRAFTEYYATKDAHEKLAKARLALRDDKRLPVIAATQKELTQLQDKARDTNLSDEEREQYYKESEMKAHELRSLQRDTQQFMDSELDKLNRLLVSVTRKLQANVQAVVTQVGTAGDYDMVFEKAGKTSSQAPTLLYIREATDITDLVIKHLNSTAPVVTPGVEPDGELPLPKGVEKP